jgi:ADP-ribose pyrophosphatase YjhB (NUDIX family)
MTNSNSTYESIPPKHVICVGSIVTKADQVLLVRQAKGHSLEGQWSIPWGFVDKTEFPDEAACRETLEESNIEARIIGLLGIQELHNQGWMAVVFLCKHTQGSPLADGGVETDRARFFTLDEIIHFEESIEPWCEWMVRKVLEGNHIVIPLEPDNPYDPLKSFL